MKHEHTTLAPSYTENELVYKVVTRGEVNNIHDNVVSVDLVGKLYVLVMMSGIIKTYHINAVRLQIHNPKRITYERS